MRVSAARSNSRWARWTETAGGASSRARLPRVDGGLRSHADSMRPRWCGERVWSGDAAREARLQACGKAKGEGGAAAGEDRDSLKSLPFSTLSKGGGVSRFTFALIEPTPSLEALIRRSRAQRAENLPECPALASEVVRYAGSSLQSRLLPAHRKVGEWL